jgi:hypothetical protein
MAGTADGWSYMGALYVVDTTKTSSNTPTFTGAGSDFQDAVDAVQGSDYTDKYGNWVRKIGDVIFIDLPFRIGDNSTATTFNDDGKVIISPKHNDTADPRIRVTTDAFRVYVYLRNNVADTCTMSGTYVWQVRSPWHFEDNNSEITFDGAIFTGMGEMDLGDNVEGDATFDDVNLIKMSSGCDLDGSTFKNPNGTYALEVSM